MLYNFSKGRRVSVPMSLLDTEGEVELVRGCINKKHAASAIIDSLGLMNDNPGPSSPVFKDPDVQKLNKRVKAAMNTFMTSGRPNVELKEALSKPETFESEVESICYDFGELIWGGSKRSHLLPARSKSNYPRDLTWENEHDRKAIKIYIRCWIIKRAARRIGEDERKSRDGQKIYAPGSGLKPKPRPQLQMRIRDEVESDYSDIEEPDVDSPQRLAPPTTKRGLFAEGLLRAPTARMYSTPPDAHPQVDTNRFRSPLFEPDDSRPVEQAVHDEREEGEYSNDDLYGDPPRPESPASPPGFNKRKRIDNSQSSQEPLPGKLPKVNASTWKRSIPEMPKSKQPETFNMPRSPPPVFATGNWPQEFGKRRTIDETQQSDPDYVPSRCSSVESETEDEDDVDQLLTEQLDSIARDLQDVGTPSQSIVEAVPATPTSLASVELDVVMRDSVIPSDNQERGMAEACNIATENEEETEEEKTTHVPDLPQPRSTTVSFGQSTRVARTPGNERELRRELFRLLLSRLNNLNQFGSSHVEAKAGEERLDQLLLQFWDADEVSLREEHATSYTTLQLALSAWMEMRARLRQFQVESRYFGLPGVDWITHLDSFEDKTQRAQALIALVDLQDTVQQNEHVGTQGFDESLMCVFDLLTKFPAGDGAKEFEGVKTYNEGLVQWFLI